MQSSSKMQSFSVQLPSACEIIIVPAKASCCCRQHLAAALSFREDPYLRRQASPSGVLYIREKCVLACVCKGSCTRMQPYLGSSLGWNFVFCFVLCWVFFVGVAVDRKIPAICCKNFVSNLSH